MQKGLLVVLQDLRRSLHGRTASFTSVLKATEDFLEENRIKLPLGELESLQEKLHRAQGQYLSLQERVEAAQKELESAVSSVKQQQTEKVGQYYGRGNFSSLLPDDPLLERPWWVLHRVGDWTGWSLLHLYIWFSHQILRGDAII